MTHEDNSVVVKSKVSRMRTWTTFYSRPAQTPECSECRIACYAVSLTRERIWWTVVYEHRSICKANKTTMIKPISLSFEICLNLPWSKPSLIFTGLLLYLWYFSILVIYHFEVFFCLKVEFCTTQKFVTSQQYRATTLLSISCHSLIL